MAYNIIGTAGNDTLNQAVDPGPGTIVGLAGNDLIRTGTGAATVDGGSGEDTVILQAGNAGSVTMGPENDSIWDQNQNISSMLLFGNEGADTINVDASTNAQTVLGGNDSADGNDSIWTGSGADLVFGHGGNDSLFAGNGNDTYVGGFGNDDILDPLTGGNDLVFANEGNDTINVYGGDDTVFAGQGDDSVVVGGADHPIFYLNEGNDTVAGGTATGAMTVVGGNDGLDGSDSIFTGSGADLVFGNGGNDTVRFNEGADTVIGGQGYDSLYNSDMEADLVFANEGDDTVMASGGENTVFGGQGADFIAGGVNALEQLNGNEGNDSIVGFAGRDIISGGSGADVFTYIFASDDGDNANAGGPLEQITDVNFDEDRFNVFEGIEYAANVGAINGPNLEASAETALQAALALGGNAAFDVAAQFSFNGRDYLVINQAGLNNTFIDQFDLLLDVTGATGTIGANDFF
jgi:Ca2+-binding RTX toxin-like protein